MPLINLLTLERGEPFPGRCSPDAVVVDQPEDESDAMDKLEGGAAEGTERQNCQPPLASVPGLLAFTSQGSFPLLRIIVYSA